MPGPITKPGTPQTTGVASSQETSSATETKQTSDSAQAKGAATTTPTPTESKSAQQLATSKRVEWSFSTIAQNLKEKVAEATRNAQTSVVQDAAKKAGLDDTEVKKLTDNLGKLDTKAFGKEVNFLTKHVLSSPNADRALRTYNDLKDMQAKHPGRLKDNHIRTLTRGVAEPRSKAHDMAKEGVMGGEQAKKAAQALIDMPAKDYKHINKMLDKANTPAVKGGSAQMERALILKAAGARLEQLSNPGTFDRLRMAAGLPSKAMSEITGFASDIRGTKRSALALQSTSTDPYRGNKALQQRWNDSCGPTTAQGMKAETDPIYARKLHQTFQAENARLQTYEKLSKAFGKIGFNFPVPDSIKIPTDTWIAKEQKSVLEAHGGKAVKRETAGGAGSYLDQVLNSEVSKYTGVKYTYHYTGGTEASRNAMLDQVADKLKAGVDVPVRAGWPGGGGHFMYMTDVRGTGDDQKFLLTDPWTGKTEWMTRKDLASGNSSFPAGKGELTHVYWE